MRRRGHLIALLGAGGFRRLFTVRLAGQFGDGVFQASLAGAVLFNPDRQAHAADIAAGFAVLLLPYSLLGPFAGVLLDNWWRQRVLVVANLLRGLAVLVVAGQIATGWTGAGFYASALVIISLGRFLLSALSAALPHVVVDAELVTANSLSTTCGALATTAGGGVAVALRALAGSTNVGYAAIAAAAVLPYLCAAAAARGFARQALGPDTSERARRERLTDVVRGLVAGIRHVRSRPPARNALVVIGVHRLCFGMWTVTTVLLYRNFFAATGPARIGLPGLTQVVVLGAAGTGLAAVATPAAARRLGHVSWSALLLTGAGAAILAGSLPFHVVPALAAALPLGFASQGVKICVDTVVQSTVADAFRGRVFALYDMLFNLALVCAAVLTAVALPEDGRSPATVVTVGVAYLAAAASYLAVGRPARLSAVPRTSP